MSMAARGTRTGVTKQCGLCGSEFYVDLRRAETARFCSHKCSSEATRTRRERCGTCGIEVTRWGARFCSPACRRAARRNGREKCCEQCGATFYVPGYRADTSRFCGRACADAWQGRNKTVHVCETCGDEFRRSPFWSAHSTQRYCSIPCRNANPDFRARLIAMNTLLQERRITGTEAIGYALLDALGVGYERQVPFNGKFTPDATVASAQLLVQFDGDYWHDRKGTSTEDRIRRRVALDHSQDAYAAACGWRVVRLWESDLRDDLEGCGERVLSALNEGHFRIPA